MTAPKWLCVWVCMWLLAAIPRVRGAQPVHVGPVIDIGRDFLVRHWTTDNGLPENRVFSVCQARDGYLWVGTRGGVLRFDGLRFQFFSRASDPDLVGGDIVRIQEEADGTVWLQNTEDGLSCFKAGDFYRPTANAGGFLRAGLVGPSARGGMWLESWSPPRLERWKNGQVEETFPLGNRGCAVLEEEPGTTWVAEPAGLHRFRPGMDPDHWSIKPQQGEGHWFATFPAGTNGIAALLASSTEADGWIYRIQGGPTDPVGPLPRHDARGCFILRPRGQSSELWMPLRKVGLLQLIGTELRPHAFPWLHRDEDYLTCGLEDREGNFWFGSEQSGLFMLRRKEVHTVLAGSNVRAVLAEGNVLWAGAVHSSLAPAVPSELQDIQAPWFANGANVTAFASAVGQTWVGTSRGLFHTAGKELMPQRLLRETNRFDTEGVGTEKVRSLAAGQDGALWIVTPHLVSVLRRGEDLPRPFLRFESSGKPTSPMACKVDRTGALWVATDGAGVLKFNQESLVRLPDGMKLEDLSPEGAAPAFVIPPDFWLTTTNALPSDHAWDLYEAADGALWIATERGLVRLAPGPVGPDPNNRFTFTTAEGLPNHQVNSLIEDGAGNLWFGTDDGLFVAPHSALLDVVEGRSNRVIPRTIGRADGMSDPETNGRLTHPGACRTADGRLWFATVKGVAVVDPARLLGREEVAPLAAVEVVRVDGEIVLANAPAEGAGAATLPPEAASPRRASARSAPTGASGRLRLDPGRARTIEFQFAGLSFNGPEGCRYEFRLDGHDRAGIWHDARAQRFALYTNLKPGDFRFQVRVANRHGRWCERPASFAFSLAPFFWQTGWFRTGTPLLALALVGAFVRWRLRERDRFHRLESDRRLAEQQLAREQELARERARIARNMHDDMGACIVQLGVLVNRLHLAESATSTARAAAQQLAETVAEASRLLRETLWTVHPADESVAGLADRLSALATDTLTPLGVAVRFDLPGVLPSTRLSAGQRSEFIRAYREVLTNIVKHAAATEFHLAISTTDSAFRAVVRDNGQGFDPFQPGTGSPDSGRGLANIRARLADLGGSALVESAPGQGTRVTLELPV